MTCPHAGGLIATQWVLQGRGGCRPPNRGLSKGPQLVFTMALDLYALITHGTELPSMTHHTCRISFMALVAKAGSTRSSVR
jgi:hypothetical protein